MASLSVQQNAELRGYLQDAVIKCSERCLYQSAKWAAELLNSLPESDAASPTDTEVASPSAESFAQANVPGIFSRNQKYHETRLEVAEAQKYLLAKTYFDCREYDRCAAVFLPMTLPRGQLKTPKDAGNPNVFTASGHNDLNGSNRPSLLDDSASTEELPKMSQKSLFLALYAKYIRGEKRKDEESEMVLGPADGGATVNKELPFISRLLEKRLTDSGAEGKEDGQGWLEYLYGIVLARGKNHEEAKRWLLKSVHLYSYNWGVWEELGSLVGSLEELSAILRHVPQNLMSYMFHVVQRQELFQFDERTFSDLDSIRALFPTSNFFRIQKAFLRHHAKDFESAEKTFAKVVSSDPCRLDDLDHYSNILYVMDRRAKLAFLAQLTTATDLFRPETCCVVGNYFAMKSDHEKAVIYFRRALSLDRTFLSAWTLMGHEYVELKNTQAAIECYRRAVDTNRKDYRAWYGLGQTYEMLEMHFYALFYYERAAALSPYDPKMWSAVGSCLASMHRPMQAIKAYKRALVSGVYREQDSSFGSSSQGGSGAVRIRPEIMLDPDILFSLAQMYFELGSIDETKGYLDLCLAQEEGDTSFGNEGDAEDSQGTRVPSITSPEGNKVSGGEESGRDLGTGVTQTTSRARLWLVRLEMEDGSLPALRRAEAMANTLCEDEYQVEEAKSMWRSVRARIEAETSRGSR